MKRNYEKLNILELHEEEEIDEYLHDITRHTFLPALTSNERVQVA